MYAEPPFEELQQTQKDELESTQLLTQGTAEANAERWAYLVPYSEALKRIKEAPKVTIGRSPMSFSPASKEQPRKHRQRQLQDRNEVVFGIVGKSKQNGLYDYPFVFSDLRPPSRE
ncbi:hypothetical protein B0H19DRAFT_1247201 [Mycena capillaripes]|nr:hypothetical protein B0H19DRAFT_1247201 [Mycena capillaripes]